MGGILIFLPQIAGSGVPVQKTIDDINKIVFTQPPEVKEFPKGTIPVELPVPKVQIAKAVIPSNNDQSQCFEAIKRHFPSNTWASAFLVVQKEGGTPTGTHLNNDGSIDHGCFQINDNWNYYRSGNLWRRKYEFSQVYDPDVNIKIAMEMSTNGTYWKPWYAVCPLDKSNPYGICPT
ncbi:MAG: hypothetical protein M0R80_18405 [Proteobacteria bacterium]|nr:hypothetical protein [Pseudomonadota bacterium]